MGFAEKVVRELRIEHTAPLHDTRGIRRGDAAGAIDRKIEQQIGVAPHAFIIDVDQPRETFELVVFPRMIEPARTYRDVALARQPCIAVGLAAGEIIEPFIAAALYHAPIRLSGPALFVAYPADVGARAAENHRSGLQFVDRPARPLVAVIGLGVDAALLVRTAVPAVAAVRAVEPVFEKRPVTGEQFAHLVVEISDILLPPVFRMVAVPRRKIDAELESVPAAGIGQLPHQIPLAAAPRGVLHAVLGIGRRPETEPVVVLGREHHAFHSGGPERPHPLVAIQIRRVERRSRSIAVPPFHVVERIEPVMDEGVGFQLLPSELTGIRHRKKRRGSFDAAACGREEQKNGERSFHGRTIIR